jgi:hypothetical protein
VVTLDIVKINCGDAIFFGRQSKTTMPASCAPDPIAGLSAVTISTAFFTIYGTRVSTGNTGFYYPVFLIPPTATSTLLQFTEYPGRAFYMPSTPQHLAQTASPQPFPFYEKRYVPTTSSAYIDAGKQQNALIGVQNGTYVAKCPMDYSQHASYRKAQSMAILL